MNPIVFQVAATVAQDYEVSDIQCSGAGTAADLLTAKIKRPVGFRGTPLFADDRSANPLADIHCQIRPDPNDPQEDNYFLKVTDFSRCGILKRNVSHRAIERVTRNRFLREGKRKRAHDDVLPWDLYLTLHKRYSLCGSRSVDSDSNSQLIPSQELLLSRDTNETLCASNRIVSG